MKRKITYLVWGCSIAMIALCTIQGYFIYNTYMLKKRDAQTLVRDALIAMEEQMNIDSIRTGWFTTVEQLVASGQYQKAERLIKQGSPSLSAKVERYIDTSEVLSRFDVGYKVVIRHIAFLDSSQQLRHFTQLDWFGALKAQPTQLVIHDLSMDNESADALVRNFKSRSLFSIGKTSNPILWEMAGLLIFSAILLGIVILLFYFSIRSLVTQKNIADMQNDFINNITHEFNTPLATLAIGIHTLAQQRQSGENKLVDHTIEVISRQHQRLKKLIEQVMQYTVGSQQLVLKKETTDMNAFLKNLIEDFQLAFPEPVITFLADPKHTSLSVDLFQLTTALTNLLENAVKYGGTQLSCSASQQGSDYAISITDNGQGIATEELQRIFEKFYRIEKGDIHNVKGLGLGLYYSNRVAIAHQGRIKVQSTVGKGSTFTFMIPLK